MPDRLFVVQAPVPGYGRAYQPALELGYLASYVRSLGYDVVATDAGLHDSAEEATEGAQGCGLAVILAAATRSVVDGARIASVLGSRGIPSAVWGTVPNVYARETLRNYPSYTFVLRGDPEAAARELLEAIVEGTSLGDVEGLTYRDRGEIVEAGGCPRVASLDDLPWPARDLLQLDRYPVTFQGPPHGHMLTSRGCYFPCTFCGASIYGPFRTRSPEKVVDEMEHLAEHYRVKRLVLRDLTLGPAKHIREICEKMLERKLRLTWYCLSHPAVLNRGILRLMREAGCTWIDLGVESGDQSVLDRYRKGTTIDRIREVFSICSELGINTQGNVLLGGPYDSPTAIRATVRLLEELNPPRDCVTRVLPIPGTPLFNEVATTGRLTSRDWADYYSDPYDADSPARGLIAQPPESEKALQWAFRRLGRRRRRRALWNDISTGRWFRRAGRRLVTRAVREAEDAWRIGAVHVLGSEGVSRVAGLIATLVLARILGAEIYGHLRVINAVLALATVFATFGLGAGVAKFVSQYPSRAGATFATSLRTGLLTSCAVAAGLFLLSSTAGVITDGVARSYLRLLAWTLPFFVVGALGLAFLYGLKRLQRKAALKAALDVCRVGLQLGGGWFMALPGVVYGKIAGSIISAIAGLGAARHKWRWRERSDLRGQLLRFSGFSFLGASFSTLLVTTDTLTISTLLGAATVVGYYGVAAPLALALTMPAAALAHSAFPYISERQNRPGRAAEYISGLVRRAIVISAPLCVAGWALGGIGVRALYGIEYAPSVGLFRILVIGAFLRSVVGPVGTAIHALGRPDVNLGLLLITGTLNVGLNILLVGAIGAAGAAWATNIVSALNLALGWWALRRMLIQRP